MPEFDNSNNLMTMMEKSVMQILKKNGVLIGNKVFGVVEEVLNSTKLRVVLLRSQDIKVVNCSPMAEFHIGDTVLIEYINNNPHDMFVVATMAGGHDIKPIDYDSLPSEPVEIIRNRETKKAEKFIYAYNEPTKAWTQELIRDKETKKVTAVRTVYPDGFILTRFLLMNDEGKLWRYE